MKPWRITWRGKSWTDADVTGAHMAAIVGVTGDKTWAGLDPWRGPEALMGYLIALTGRADEVMAAKAEEIVGALTAKED